MEGDFNQWDKNSRQSWAMEAGENKEWYLLLNLDDISDNFAYRFSTGFAKGLDPELRKICFFAGGGICSQRGAKQQYDISFALGIHYDEKGDKQAPESTQYGLHAAPAWLLPKARKIHTGSSSPGLVAFRFLPSHKEAQGEVQIRNLSKKDDQYTIPIAYQLRPLPIFAHLASSEICYPHAVGRGQKISIPLEFHSCGKGKLQCMALGSGISETFLLESENEEERSHKISLNVDTSRLTPGLAKSFRLFIYTDSLLSNRRYMEANIHLEVVSLAIYPLIRLDWTGICHGDSVSQKLEFFRSDTMEPVEIQKVTGPQSLQDSLEITWPARESNQVSLSLATRDLESGRKYEEELCIEAICKDGLSLRHKVPMLVQAETALACITVSYGILPGPGRMRGVTVTLHNVGKSPLRVFGMSWIMGLFRFYKHFAGKAGEPIILPGEKRQWPFLPKPKRQWILSRQVADRITIVTNSVYQPTAVLDIAFRQPSRLMGIFSK